MNRYAQEITPFQTAASCSKPTISGASLNPTTASIASGAKYTVTCDNDKTMTGQAVMNCTNGVLSAAPTCASASCSKPTISGGSLNPTTASIASGAKYTVTCDNDKTMTGQAVMNCTNGVLSAAPTCVSASCSKPTISNGTVTPLRGPINSGSRYTVICDNDTSINGSTYITCTNGKLSTAPTCFEGTTVSKCSVPVFYFLC